MKSSSRRADRWHHLPTALLALGLVTVSITFAPQALAQQARPEVLSGAYVTAIQEALVARGFMTGPATGTLDQRTRDAVREYQKRAGLPVDGVPSQALLDHIKFAEPRVTPAAPTRPRQDQTQPPARTAPPAPPQAQRPDPSARPQSGNPVNPSIAEIERLLAERGYAPGPVDGVPDRRARDALLEFQSDEGLPQTGAFDDRALDALRNPSARAQRRPAPSSEAQRQPVQPAPSAPPAAAPRVAAPVPVPAPVPAPGGSDQKVPSPTTPSGGPPVAPSSGAEDPGVVRRAWSWLFQSSESRSESEQSQSSEQMLFESPGDKPKDPPETGKEPAPAPPAPPLSPPPAPEPRAEAVQEQEARERGAEAGELEVYLAWNSPRDLDVHVTCPSGETVMFLDMSACGGRLDLDENASGGPTRPDPIEHVVYPSPPPGRYVVGVANCQNDGAPAEPFRLWVVHRGKTIARKDGASPPTPPSPSLLWRCGAPREVLEFTVE